MIIWIVFIILLLIALLAFIYSNHLFSSLNISSKKIIFSDHNHWKKLKNALFDPQYNLFGRPDYIVSIKDRLIPIEIKSTYNPKSEPYKEHVIQLIAYCYLIEKNFSIIPPYGELHYQNKKFIIPYTDENKITLFNTLRAIQKMKKENTILRNHNNPSKCNKCSYRNSCEQKIS